MCIILTYIHINIGAVRTNIVIDDRLMKEALRVSGLKTKKDAVEKGLKSLIQLHKQSVLKDLKGQITWEGDLDVMRGATGV